MKIIFEIFGTNFNNKLFLFEMYNISQEWKNLLNNIKVILSRVLISKYIEHIQLTLQKN